MVGLEVGCGNLALANPAAIKLDREAEALVDDVDDRPRTRVVVVGQLRMVAVAVERGRRFLDKDTVTNGGLSSRRLPHHLSVALLSLPVARSVAEGEDLLGHALLVGNGPLEPAAERGAVQGRRHGVEVAAGVPSEEHTVR